MSVEREEKFENLLKGRVDLDFLCNDFNDQDLKSVIEECDEELLHEIKKGVVKAFRWEGRSHALKILSEILNNKKHPAFKLLNAKRDFNPFSKKSRTVDNLEKRKKRLQADMDDEVARIQQVCLEERIDGSHAVMEDEKQASGFEMVKSVFESVFVDDNGLQDEFLRPLERIYLGAEQGKPYQWTFEVSLCRGYDLHLVQKMLRFIEKMREHDYGNQQGQKMPPLFMRMLEQFEVRLDRRIVELLKKPLTPGDLDLLCDKFFSTLKKCKRWNWERRSIIKKCIVESLSDLEHANPRHAFKVLNTILQEGHPVRELLSIERNEWQLPGHDQTASMTLLTEMQARLQAKLSPKPSVEDGGMISSSGWMQFWRRASGPVVVSPAPVDKSHSINRGEVGNAHIVNEML